MQPENITIHCLARKKGSPLRFGPQGQLPARTLDTAYAMLEQAGYAPYYLYRQKYIAGNLENVGFAKGDTICRYNILMMEELCPVVALGAGGVTKICADGGRNITRLTNPKYPRSILNTATKSAKGSRSWSWSLPCCLIERDGPFWYTENRIKGEGEAPSVLWKGVTDGYGSESQ